MTDRLEARNLVERRVNPDDKRYTCVYLTALLNEHKNKFTPHLFIPIIEHLNDLSKDKRERVLEGLSILNGIFMEE